jgi:hypothetical protein
LKVESAQQASPIPQKQNKKDLNPAPNPLKKEPCTCKLPPKTNKKKGFIPTSNLPRTKVKGLYFSNNFYWNFKV